MTPSKNITIEEISCPCGCGYGTRIHDLDPEIAVIFEAIRYCVGGPIKILSGCRCWHHQGKIRKDFALAAKFSPHCSGQALDLAVPEGKTLKEFYLLCSQVLAAMTGKRGGCGIYYPGAGNFVHIDLGKGYIPDRRWTA